MTFVSGFLQRHVSEAHPRCSEGQRLIPFLSARLMLDIWVVSAFWPSWIELLSYTFVYAFAGVNLFSVPLGIYLGAESLGHMGILHLTFRETTEFLHFFFFFLIRGDGENVERLVACPLWVDLFPRLLPPLSQWLVTGYQMETVVRLVFS